ncbi:hypothetical protein VNI00_010418 [Paramarasmius palmivorus]|uniref:Uncharacterized protein n=1 Tax=Paramarasmius palmivorus TaxID=297713 RepID=A0AAW0CMB1_9AGAR
MSDTLSLLANLVALGFKLKEAVEKIKGNKETHRTLVHRINNSLRSLNQECSKITARSSPSLRRAIKKLKSDMEHALESCNKPAARATMSNFMHWFNKDSIEAALLAIDKQIVACFQEFTALSTIRIERKLGHHNVEVNRKLDELLRRTPKVRDGSASPVTQRRTLQKTPKPTSPPVITRGILSPKSDISSLSSTSSTIPKSASVDRIHQSPVHPVRVPFPSRMRSSSSQSSTSTQSHTSSLRPNRPSTLRSLHQQADDLDAEHRRLRSHNFPTEAMIAARKAVGLRRIIVSLDENARTTGALANSLTHVARCLKDLDVSHRLGTISHHHERELLNILSESVALYREAFRAETSFRLELGNALYNLSVCLAEAWTNRKAARSVGGGLNMPSLPGHYRVKELNGDTSLMAALDAAHEAVHHFSVLENEEPELYGFNLANALLNQSFILSDLGKGEKALGTARRAVALAGQFLTSLEELPGERRDAFEERAKRAKVLHKAWMRVSYCLEYLGRREESAEAEQEANRVLDDQIKV